VPSFFIIIYLQQSILEEEKFLKSGFFFFYQVSRFAQLGLLGMLETENFKFEDYKKGILLYDLRITCSYVNS